jgi:hypothetical protein
MVGSVGFLLRKNFTLRRITTSVEISQEFESFDPDCSRIFEETEVEVVAEFI